MSNQQNLVQNNQNVVNQKFIPQQNVVRVVQQPQVLNPNQVNPVVQQRVVTNTGQRVVFQQQPVYYQQRPVTNAQPVYVHQQRALTNTGQRLVVQQQPQRAMTNTGQRVVQQQPVYVQQQPQRALTNTGQNVQYVQQRAMTNTGQQVVVNRPVVTTTTTTTTRIVRRGQPKKKDDVSGKIVNEGDVNKGETYFLCENDAQLASDGLNKLSFITGFWIAIKYTGHSFSVLKVMAKHMICEIFLLILVHITSIFIVFISNFIVGLLLFGVAVQGLKLDGQTAGGVSWSYVFIMSFLQYTVVDMWLYTMLQPLLFRRITFFVQELMLGREADEIVQRMKNGKIKALKCSTSHIFYLFVHFLFLIVEFVPLYFFSLSAWVLGIVLLMFIFCSLCCFVCLCWCVGSYALRTASYDYENSNHFNGIMFSLKNFLLSVGLGLMLSVLNLVPIFNIITVVIATIVATKIVTHFDYHYAKSRGLVSKGIVMEDVNGVSPNIPSNNNNNNNENDVNKNAKDRGFSDAMLDYTATEESMKKFAELKINSSLFEVNYADLKVKKRIGSGGSSSYVYAAEWQGIMVAFKCFKLEDFLEDQKFSEFEQEAKILGSISHPFILKFYGSTLKPPRVGIVMEFCENGDIRQYLEKNPDAPPKTRVRWLKEIATACNFLHSKKIIHRDLKPENVLLDNALRTRLMDFGISKLVDRIDQAKTKGIGTSYYMAPEVVKGMNYSEKCDVFSFGMMAFNIVSGNFNPFGKSTEFKLEFKIASDNTFRPDCAELKGKYDDGLIGLMESCWSGTEGERPAFNKIKDMFVKFEEQMK